jgi:outer membrane protein assembly factor BamB
MAPFGEGYVIAGQTESFGNGDWDVYLIHVSQDGDVLWTTTAGGKDVDRVFFVTTTEDGQAVFAGMSSSDSAGELDAYLVAVNTEGELQWERRYGGANNDIGHGVVATAEGGFLITGYGFSDETQGNDVHLWRVDAEGELLWETQIGDERDERAMMGVVRSDESFAVVGYADGNAEVLHVTSSGELLATRTFEHPGFDRGVMIRETRDGGFVMTGAWAAPDTEHSDLRLIFFSLNDNLPTKEPTS